jgi:hypothetical protein
MIIAPRYRLSSICAHILTAEIIYTQCQRPAQHEIVKRLHQRCSASPKPGPRYAESTYDSALGSHLPSNRNAPCKFCRDSGASIGPCTRCRRCSEAILHLSLQYTRSLAEDEAKPLLQHRYRCKKKHWLVGRLRCCCGVLGPPQYLSRSYFCLILAGLLATTTAECPRP